MKTGLRVVLGLGMATAVVLAGLLFYPRASARSETAERGQVSSGPSLVSVSVTPVAVRTFEERVAVQGDVEAKNFAMVSSRVAGTIETFFVDEGDEVRAGETALFQIDALKMEKAVEIARQDSAVAKCALQEKQANLEQVRADLYQAERDHERYKLMYEEDLVSLEVLDAQESRHKQARALLKHAQSLVDLSVEQQRQAEAALVMAEKDLSDALVIAPIDGRVSARLQEVGEMGDVGKSVLRIDDLSVLEVSVFLPEQYYGRVIPRETVVRVRVHGIDVGESTVSYKSPTINPGLRTFEAKCALDSPPEGVVPGAIADVEFLLESRMAPGIPQNAVQARASGSVVFVLEGDTARMTAVEPGLETDGWVELLGGQVAEGTPVITTGQYLIDDGARVAVREGQA